MKPNCCSLITAAALALSTGFVLAQGSSTSLAVFPFETSNPEERERGQAFAELLAAQLSTSPTLILVERAQIDAALGELELGLSGAVSADSAAGVGGMVGAQALVTGRLIHFGDRTKVVAKVIGTETGRVFMASEDVLGQDELDRASKVISEKISKIVADHRTELLGNPVTFESIVASLKASVDGRKLPTVHVSIAEQHLSRPVPDPAAETEIKRVLEALGFKLVGADAEVSVSGEAFSEFGMRKGNIVACRARVETKVEDKRGDHGMWVDRETIGAVDIAEHTAAKSALQAAGLRLADRLVKKIVAAK